MHPSRPSAPMAEATVRTPGVPLDVLAAILRAHLADPTATILDCASTSFPHQGTNDSTTFWQVTFTWSRLTRALGVHTTTWIVKHWQAGGVRDHTLGIAQARDVLGWERGWFHPAALPAGLVVPFLGAWRAPDHTEAWLAMADVSPALAAYPRLALTGEQAISRTRTILARLAPFHARWEHPERQAELQACAWLRRPEHFLWDMAPTYAGALGCSPLAQTPRAASAPPVWEGLRADLDAFLMARPADERRLWERVLIDRRAIVDGLAQYPPTLLHNDLDDRNIGLQGVGAGDPGAAPLPDLVLIDWEWMALGPAAMDVANLVQRVPIMITLGTPIPEVVWSNAFADQYFAHYRAAGGTCAEEAGWRHAFSLALIAHGVAQMPFLHGQLRRAMRGELPPPQIVGVPEAVVRQQLRSGLPMMERMEARVIGEARRWLG